MIRKKKHLELLNKKETFCKSVDAGARKKCTKSF